MKKIISLFAFVAIVLLFIVFVGYTIRNNETTDTDEVLKEVIVKETEEEVIPEPTEGGTLKIAVNNPTTLNPLLNKDWSIDMLLKLMYDSLVVLDGDQKPEMSLAQSVDVNIDGTYLTIALNQNILWHDGEAFTADDVVFTVDALKELGTESTYAKSMENVIDAKIIDDFTVEILLKQPYSGYLYALTFPIIPEHIYNHQDLKTAELPPVGTGPYRFVEFIPMQSISLSKNSNWHGDFLYIDKVEASITRDEEAHVSSMEAKVTNALYTQQVDWSKFTSNKDWQVNEFTTYYYDFIGFNFNKPSLQDKSLRQAMVYAINRKGIIDDYLMGYGEMTETPIHPDSWLSTSNAVVYDYNMNKASQLLNNQENNPLSFELIVSNSDPARIAIANAIKANLKDIGIEILIVPLDPDTFYQRIEADDFDLFYGGWYLSPIMDLTFAFGTNGTGNYINYSSPSMDELLKETFLAMDDASMKKAYTSLGEYIQQEVPYISLFFRKNALITGENVYGEKEPTTNNIFDSIENWYIVE